MSTPAEEKVRKIATEYARLSVERSAIRSEKVKADAFDALAANNEECRPFADIWWSVVGGGEVPNG